MKNIKNIQEVLKEKIIALISKKEEGEKDDFLFLENISDNYLALYKEDVGIFNALVKRGIKNG